MDCEKFELGDVSLLSGEELNSAFLIYKTYGKLNKGKDNVVVMPTFYTGSHQEMRASLAKVRQLIRQNILLFQLTYLVMVSPLRRVIQNRLKMAQDSRVSLFGIILLASTSY